jgi:drug/metabolite transporter (DMT)-like permease
VTSRIRGEVLIVAAAIGWGSAYPATVLSLETLAPLGAAAWRGGLSALVMIIVLVVLREAPLQGIGRRQALPLAVLGLLGGTAFMSGLNVSVHEAGSSVTAFVMGSFPIIMVVTAPLVLGERLTSRGIAAAALALGGVALLTRPGTEVTTLALVAATIASISFALYLQLARRWGALYGLRPGVVSVVVMAAVPLGCVPAQLLLDPAGLVPALTPGEIAAFAWLVLPAGSLAHVAANEAVRRLPAGRSSSFLFLAPLTGVVIGTLFLGERLDAIQLVGGTSIIVGIIVATAPGRAAFRTRRVATLREDP